MADTQPMLDDLPSDLAIRRIPSETADGSTSVTRYESTQFRGLAVEADYGSDGLRWRIVHVESGLTLDIDSDRLDVCLMTAVHVARHGEWANVDREVLTAVSELRKFAADLHGKVEPDEDKRNVESDGAANGLT